MRRTLSLFCAIVSLYAMGQERLIVSAPLVSYADQSTTQVHGFYTRGTVLDNYEVISPSLYLIAVDYAPSLYIKDTNLLTDRLFSTTDNSALSPVIEPNAAYGSPHLYTTVAGLKVREYPDAAAAVLGTVLNGTVFPVTYYPYDEKEWIKIPYGEGYGYIPVKYTGAKPNLTELIATYNKANTTAEKKKYAERILELGWNSTTKENLQALSLFIAYAEANEMHEVATRLQLQKEVIKARPKIFSYKTKEKWQQAGSFGFSVHEIVEPATGFEKEFIAQWVGYPVDSYADLEDCTLGDYESVSFYNGAEFITNDYTDYLQTRQMDMINQQGFILNNHLLNGDTSEELFLQLGKGFISQINAATGDYFIDFEDHTYQFIFRNNKLFQVVLINYC